MTRPRGRPAGLMLDGPKISALRVDQGLSTAQLAARVHVHAESIRRAEKGGPVSDVVTSRIARALGVTVEDIACEGAAA